jgi:hypothetical protein
MVVDVDVVVVTGWQRLAARSRNQMMGQQKPATTTNDLRRTDPISQ